MINYGTLIDSSSITWFDSLVRSCLWNHLAQGERKHLDQLISRHDRYECMRMLARLMSDDHTHSHRLCNHKSSEYKFGHIISQQNETTRLGASWRKKTIQYNNFKKQVAGGHTHRRKQLRNKLSNLPCLACPPPPASSLTTGETTMICNHNHGPNLYRPLIRS